MKPLRQKRTLWLCVNFLTVATLVAVVTIIGIRIVEMKRAPPALVTMFELVPKDEGEALMRAAESLSPRDVALALDRIREVQFCTENLEADRYDLSKSSSACVWRGISAATHLAARRESQATVPLKSSLTRAF